MRAAALLALLAACAPPPDPKRAPVDTQPPETDAPDTDAPDTAPDRDTDLPSWEACYPGPASAWDACLPLDPASAVTEPGYAYPSPLDARYAPPARYLDLSTTPETARVAPNFVLSELAQAFKGRWAVVQPGAVDALQAVRDAAGGPVIVNSGYRNVAYNDSVGGATYSRHMYGDAFDIRSTAVPLDQLGAICEAAGAGYVGYYASHVHCDWRNDGNDPAFFAAAGPVDPPLALASRPVALAARPVHAAALQPPAQDGAWSTTWTGWDEGTPAHRWAARDARGVVLAEGAGARFLPPPGSATIEVVVGQVVHLRQALRAAEAPPAR